MRTDMAKLLVLRGATGGGYRKHCRHRQRAKIDPDYLPTKLPKSRRDRYTNGGKGFDEYFAPLKRWLVKQVGRPWHKVEGELSRQVPRDSAVNVHVWQHLEHFVATEVHIDAGEPCRLGPYSLRGSVCYVCPKTGLLRKTPRWRYRPIPRRPTRPCLSINESHCYRRYDELWFRCRRPQYEEEVIDEDGWVRERQIGGRELRDVRQRWEQQQRRLACQR